VAASGGPGGGTAPGGGPNIEGHIHSQLNNIPLDLTIKLKKTIRHFGAADCRVIQSLLCF
jgi:hypothetical protein